MEHTAGSVSSVAAARQEAVKAPQATHPAEHPAVITPSTKPSQAPGGRSQSQPQSQPVPAPDAPDAPAAPKAAADRAQAPPQASSPVQQVRARLSDADEKASKARQAASPVGDMRNCTAAAAPARQPGEALPKGAAKATRSGKAREDSAVTPKGRPLRAGRAHPETKVALGWLRRAAVSQTDLGALEAQVGRQRTPAPPSPTYAGSSADGC